MINKSREITKFASLVPLISSDSPINLVLIGKYCDKNSEELLSLFTLNIQTLQIEWPEYLKPIGEQVVDAISQLTHFNKIELWNGDDKYIYQDFIGERRETRRHFGELFDQPR
jgi:hypothetical protein